VTAGASANLSHAEVGDILRVGIFSVWPGRV
jgi:hypothetical protein